MHFRSRAVLLLIPVIAIAVACDNGPSTVIPPTNPSVTETFAGTLTKNGSITHQFAVTSRGTVTVTLTKVDPDATLAIGVSLGTWNGASCQLILSNDATTVGSGVLGTVSGVANLCLKVYDAAGTVPATSEAYSVDVAHP
jgi:hypothetical protein